jgi:predicted nucleotidyltransferase
MSRPASVGRIITVARELGPLADEVVFIGGAIAPLLHTDSPLPSPRATKDVDGVVASHRYGDSGRLHDALRQRGFRHDVTAAAHVHRWITPSGELFDLVPSGSHVGGSGNEWDVAAIESAITLTMDGVTFRHASAPAFIAMKIEAFNDRGEGDARGSHDIEDIVALIASRPTVVTEIDAAASNVRSKVRGFAARLLKAGIAEEVISAQLNNAEDPASAVAFTLAQIEEIAALK